jgi:hypothetical protein
MIGLTLLTRREENGERKWKESEGTRRLTKKKERENKYIKMKI